MFIKFFLKKFKVNKTNIFLFSFLFTQIVIPTFEMIKPSSASAGTKLGENASASSGATAIGASTFAAGENSTALGDDATAVTFSGPGGATALGAGATASHSSSTAIGFNAETNNDNQIVLGTSSETTIIKGDLTTNGTSTLSTVNIGSKLLVNGRDVEQSINNVGAMSAALTGLPSIPVDTNLACGVGTGTHGGDFAFSGGCASKLNENLSVNYAASMILPGQNFAGDFEDQFSARAGFVWKLGKSNDSTNISLNATKELKKEVKALKDKNDAIISQNAKLLARLEKLENITFMFQKNEELKLSKGLQKR